MSAIPCARCGLPMDRSSLGGLCPRCVALDFFAPAPRDSESAAPLLEGIERRIGDYELLEEIARGGMGVVYRARQISLDREVAVKLVLHGVLTGDAALARFRAEAAAAASLQHPNIVAIHEVGEHRGRHFFSMDYVAGRTLADRVREGPLDSNQAARYLQRIAEAIQYAHDHGVLHRDLKPSNVLIDANDEPRITDFGLAKRIDAESDLTLSGQVLGTPAYMAPEQAAPSPRSSRRQEAHADSQKRGNGETGKRRVSPTPCFPDSPLQEPHAGHVGPCSDIYSLGALLYHVLTSRPPFTGESPTQVLAQVLGNDPVAPRLLNPAVPLDLETICLKCLEKEPNRRYATAQELADELGRFLRNEPILARPITRAERLWRWSRRKPALASSLAACLLILVGGVAGILWQLRQTKAANAVAVQKAKDEEAQRRIAQQAQKQAQQSELVMRQNLYAADMLGVQRALEQNDLGTARQLLDAHRPKPGQADLRGFEWRYFWGQARGDSFATLIADTNAPVSAVSFSPDGQWLAFSSASVFLCNAADLKIRQRAEFEWPSSLGFLPNGQTILVGDRTRICRWDWAQGKPTNYFSTPLEWPLVVASPDGSWMAAGDYSSLMLDRERDGMTTIQPLVGNSLARTLPESGGIPAISSDGRLLATGSWRNQIKVWRMPEGEYVGALTNAPRVIALALSPDKQTLVASTFYEGCWLYKLATGARQRVATGHVGRVTHEAFSPDGATLATGGADQTVRLWDAKSGRETDCLRGHSFAISQVSWSPDGQTLASAGLDSSVRLWRVPRVQPPEPRLDGWLMPRAFSRDGRWLAVANSYEQCTVYEFPALRVAGSSPRPVGVPLGFVPDGTLLISIQQTTNRERCEVVWSRVGDSSVMKQTLLPDSQGSLLTARLSPDGQWLAGGSQPGEVLLWNLNPDGRVTRLKAPRGGRVRFLTFSPDSRLLAAHFEEPATAFLWELETDKPPIALPDTGAWSHSVFTPDGLTLVIGDTARRITLWHIATHQESAVLSGHTAGISTLDVSPDGQTLASSGDDGTVRLWNLATRREVARFATQLGSSRVCFAPDGGALLIHEFISGRWQVSIRWRAPGFDEKDDSAAGR